MKKIFSLLWGIAIIALSAVSCTFAYTQEQLDAYRWAYQYWITTQPTVQSANLDGKVTRQSLSKMIVTYLENIVKTKINPKDLCYFTDSDKITGDLKYYTRKVCAYKIMWQDWKNFKPKQYVDRAQLWTVFSRILRWDRHDSTGKSYYIYHVNALENAWIMDDLQNVSWVPASRWEVFVMLKRMAEKFGSNIYMSSWSQVASPIIQQQTTKQQVSKQETTVVVRVNTGTETNNEYISSAYNNSNVLYTWKDWTKYYYDDKFLTMLKNAAEKKWESDLADYLEIEAEYFKNWLDQLSSLDDEQLLKSMWIDVDGIDPDNMTLKEKQDLLKKFKAGFSKIINDNKDRNDNLVKDLNKVTKYIKNDKFWLKEKYDKTKTFMETSNQFLDLYSESIFSLMEVALMEEDENSEESVAQAFWLIAIALAYQWNAQEYQTYIEWWAVDTLNTLTK